MCLVLQSEVILANVLSKAKDDYGIDKDGLAKYCIEVKNALAQLNGLDNEYIYFDLEEQSLYNAVKEYRSYFLKFGDKIYSNKKFNVNYFNSRLKPIISNTLENVATQCAIELCVR